MTKFRKIVSGLLTVSTSLALSGLGVAASAMAGALQESNVTLAANTSGTTTVHTIDFKVASTTNVKGFKFLYTTSASGVATAVPTIDTTNSLTVVVSIGGTPNAGWSVASGTDGTVTVTKAAGTGALSAGDRLTVELTNVINNSSTTNDCDAIAQSETCFIRTTTHNDNTTLDGTTLIDSGVATYTVITPVTVTATVDPSLAFTVTGTTQLSDINTRDTNASCTGADVVATATAIPFGNVTVNTEVCGQQGLALATNANYGASVTQKFVGASATANMMVGTISGNNIDPFNNSTPSWGSPQLFNVAPSGTTPNVDTAWLGMRTTSNSGVAGFNSANLYAPPAVNNTATLGNKVMDFSGPTNVTSYVTYKLRTNALQQADTYTGTAVYNVFAKY